MIFAVHVNSLAFDFHRVCIYSVVNSIHNKQPQAIRSHNHEHNNTIYIILERFWETRVNKRINHFWIMENGNISSIFQVRYSKRTAYIEFSY